MQRRKPSVVVRECSGKKLIKIKFSMQWPTKANDLKVTNFKTPKRLDLFLSGVLASNPDAVTDRIARLKLFFSQDLIYAGMYSNFLTSFCYIFRNTTS